METTEIVEPTHLSQSSRFWSAIVFSSKVRPSISLVVPLVVNLKHSFVNLSLLFCLPLAESQEMHANLPSSCKVHYQNSNELHRFELIITPEESYWKGGCFRFVVDVPEEYNFSPPKVKCHTRIWHPNITEDGDICLSLLRESAIDGMGWAPTRTLKDVIWGLNSLFTDLLNFEDSLNHEAAEHYHQNPTEFQYKVRDYLYRFAKN